MLKLIQGGTRPARGSDSASGSSRMNLPAAMAIVFAATTSLVAAFQMALALGAPWGAYAMGGAFPGRMPTPMRVAAVVQAALLIGLALLVLASADMLDGAPIGEWPWLAWVPVAVSAVAVVLNASTRSAGERRIWLPVAVVLLVTSFIVAIS